jgi:hypothetical protein
MVEIYNEQVRDLLSNDIAQKRYPSFTHLLPPPPKKNVYFLLEYLMIAFLVLAYCQTCTEKTCSS